MMLLRKVEKFLRRQGKPLVNFVFKVGELFIFITQSVYNCLTPPFYGRNLLRQIIDMGFYSLPVVGLTTILPEWLLPCKVIPVLLLLALKAWLPALS